MNRKTKIDIIIVLCWIVSYILLTGYLLKRGEEAGDIALWLSVITPIVMGVRSMITSWFFGYPILKPVLVHETRVGNSGSKIHLMLKNEGHEAAKTANVWCTTREGSIEKLDCSLLASVGYIINPDAFVKGDEYHESVFLHPHIDEDKKLRIKVETIGADSKKTYCACRLFTKNIMDFSFDNNEDRNTKPYLFKFKPCKDCKFREGVNATKKQRGCLAEWL